MNKNTIGGRIRLARENKNWTQDELREKAGISKGFLSDVENNKRNPSITNALALAEALGVSVEWLARGKQKTMKCPLCKGKGEFSM